MRDVGSALNTHLSTPGPRMAEILLWVRCRNRATGTVEPVGLWTGPTAMDFNIGGEVRTYYGNGAITSDPRVTNATGLDVRLASIGLSRLHDAVRLMLDTRDPRNAPAEIRRANYDPATGALIDEPVLVFDGKVNVPEAKSGGLGASHEVALKLAPVTELLTYTLALNWSDETGRLNGDDRILRYAVVSGQATVWWGANRVASN